MNSVTIVQRREHDDNIFNSCKVKKNDKKYVSNVGQVFPPQETTRKHKNDIFTRTHTKKVAMHACHVIAGFPCEEAGIRCPLMVLTYIKYNSKFGLYRNMDVAVGLLYAISLTLKNDDGLINGARCAIKI